ncbi:MFS transporter [Nocardioides sp. NPDC057767]|uniref:MFS transporter n=1 Tax=unclassified Nocardioides TaxID=2615069 RepID=UPI00367154AF
MQTPPGHDETPGAGPRAWTPWRTVFAFGLVSLCADMVYEGMRAMAGPYLGSLGASALTVGLITGAGEGIALVLRLVTGVWADRSHNHWRLTVLGYAMTAVCVPLLAVAPFIGGAGLAVAATLILLDRTGKAVRSPAKSALLARMSTSTGRGKGFAVHKALDQVGAFSGPLLLAGVAAATGLIWPGFALLAVPGAVSLLLLAQLRRRAPIVTEPEADPQVAAAAPGRSSLAELGRAVTGGDLPRTFHLFSLAAAMMTAGLMTFGVISFRMVDDGLLLAAAVPLVYALAMAVEALAALGTGQLFDRRGSRVLLVVPALVALVPLCVFASELWLVLAGVVVWGVAYGVQDSTVKAYVADLVPAPRRATAYGVFAAVQGLGALAGGGLAGALVTGHVPVLAGVIGGLQVAAFALLVHVTARRPGPA